MKITVNYTINDIFNGNHIISAIKEKASYIDICQLISDMNKSDDPTNYVVHADLDNEITNIKSVMFYYDKISDRDKRILTIGYLFENNELDNYYRSVPEIKKFFREYLKREESCQIEKQSV